MWKNRLQATMFVLSLLNHQQHSTSLFPAHRWASYRHQQWQGCTSQTVLAYAYDAYLQWHRRHGMYLITTYELHFQSLVQTTKAITWSCTDHFAAGTIYLVSNSGLLSCLFPNFTFSQKWICFSCDLELWPMTLAYESDLYRDKMNYHAKYQRHKSFHLKVIVQTHTHTHSCLTQLHDDKVISNEHP